MRRFIKFAGLALGAAMAANEVWAQPSGGLSQRINATWTSATANNTNLTLQVAGYSTIGVTFSNNALAIASGNLNFEIDNGSNTWWPLQCYRLTGAANESAFNMAGANQVWQCPVAGMVQARVRLNPVISGNNALISIQASAGVTIAANLAAVLTNNNVNATIVSGNSNVAITSGNSNVAVTSGNLNATATISSGNSNVAITSGNSNVSALPVYGNIASNQQAVTTANASLQNVAGIAGLCVTTTTTSNASAFVGATGVSTSNGMELPPGSSWCTNATNPNVIFVIAAANGTTTVSWAAMKP